MPDLSRWRTPSQIRIRGDAELATAWNGAIHGRLSSGRTRGPGRGPGPHTRVRVAMLRTALRPLDRRNAMGRVVRLIVPGPGSLAGRYPPGNTGRTTTGLTETAPLPHDIEQFLTQFAVAR